MTPQERKVMELALEALKHGVRGMNLKGCALECMPLHEAITAIKEASAQPEQEPLDTPLPCDVKVGHVTIRKGVALSVLVARMQVLYDMAQPKEPEQEPARSALVAANRERDGWMQVAEDLTKSLRFARADLDLMRSHQDKNVWYWQGDGYDHLESMGNTMVVVIHAHDLRDLISPPQRKQLKDWIDPNDKTQDQFLPNIGEPVLFCHEGKAYYGKHGGGSFMCGSGITKKHFNTWECHWMPVPAAHGIKE